MNEDYLQHVWRFSLYKINELKTADGRALRVIYPGIHNRSSGPDFLNARIMIDNTLWVGHVEVHLRSSDWDRHGHSEDEQYNMVILHAVLTHDRDISAAGVVLPVLELGKFLDPGTYGRYVSWQ